MKKKILSIFIIVCLLLVNAVGFTSFAAEDKKVIFSSAGMTPNWGVDGKESYSVGFHFKANDPFVGGVDYIYASVGETDIDANVKLYKWNTDYATSVASDVKASASFKVNGDKAYEYNFGSAQPAGEYLVVVTLSGINYGGQPREYAIQASVEDSSKVETFFNGDVSNDFYAGILFESDGGTLSDVGYTTYRKALFDPNVAGNPITLSSNFSTLYAMQFNAKASFTYLNICCPSWGNNIGDLKWTLYKWNGTFYKSIESTPLVSEEFKGFADGTEIYLKFDPIEAGEYLLVIENITEGDKKDDVGMWGAGSSGGHMNCFIKDNDGSIKLYSESIPKLYISYTEDVSDEPGALSEPTIGVPNEQEPENPDNPSIPDDPTPPPTGDISMIVIIAASVILLSAMLKRKVFN